MDVDPVIVQAFGMFYTFFGYNLSLSNSIVIHIHGMDCMKYFSNSFSITKIDDGNRKKMRIYL